VYTLRGSKTCRNTYFHSISLYTEKEKEKRKVKGVVAVVIAGGNKRSNGARVPKNLRYVCVRATRTPGRAPPGLPISI
jgi:hypothetical protein